MDSMAKLRLRLPAYCLACLLGSLAVFATTSPQQDQKPQQPAAQQRPTPTVSVEAAMVVVDVTVRDNKGDLLTDLKKEDFKVYEDNVPQSIITFAAEKVAIGAPPAEAAPYSWWPPNSAQGWSAQKPAVEQNTRASILPWLERSGHRHRCMVPGNVLLMAVDEARHSPPARRTWHWHT